MGFSAFDAACAESGPLTDWSARNEDKAALLAIVYMGDRNFAGKFIRLAADDVVTGFRRESNYYEAVKPRLSRLVSFSAEATESGNT